MQEPNFLDLLIVEYQRSMKRDPDELALTYLEVISNPWTEQDKKVQAVIGLAHSSFKDGADEKFTQMMGITAPVSK